jgi:hypothetical protein
VSLLLVYALLVSCSRRPPVESYGEVRAPSVAYAETAARPMAQRSRAYPASATAAPAAVPYGTAARGAVAAEEMDTDQAAGPGGFEGGAANEPAPTWQRAQASANAVRLAIGDRETLPLRGMQVRVQVDGFRARVLVDAYFLNDRDRNYEGTFQLRLPDGATPYFFAFGETTYQAPSGQDLAVPFFPASQGQGAGLSPEEIMSQRAPSWNSPREARVVPRERAALAYTETVRQRVDPALMEWSGAGMFEARVFPLQPAKLHRVSFGYDTTLDRAGEEWVLPVNLPAGVQDLVVDLAVARAAGQTVRVSPAIAARNDGAYESYRFERPQERQLMVRLRGAAPTLVGSDAQTGPYLAAMVQPTLPAQSERAGSDTAVFLLDTSLSTQPEQFNTWLRLMQSVLERNRPTLRQFAVLFFDVSTRWWRTGWTDNSPENVQALLRDAHALALEGATDLSAALRAATAPPWVPAGARMKWDTFLLGDGAATWGETDPARIALPFAEARRGPLFGYRLAGTAGDSAMLARLARESSGGVFTLASEAEVPAAAVAHQSNAWAIRSVALEGASDLLVAGRPTTLFPGQTLVLAARGMPAAGASVVLELERGSTRHTVRVPLGPTVSSSLAPRVYGQLAVESLEEFTPATESAARSYATHFRVVGRTCSLVMLETEADYQRFGIVPADEARRVRSTPVQAQLAEAQQALGRALGDAKAAFLAWLERLPQQPGVSLTVPPALHAALARMPAAAFTVVPERLEPRVFRRDDLPGRHRAHLTESELDYDRVSEEAERRRRQSGAADGLVALSSLIEQRPGDTVLARDVAFTAAEWGLPGAGYHLLRRVAEMRPYEPHTYRSLAETLAAMGRNDLALAYFEIGLAGEWGPRSRDFQQILGVQYVHFLREVARGARTVSVPEFARARIAEVEQTVGLERADVLVMIAWNTDQTDVDLHVIEPTGEECFYAHRETRMGGRLTQDVVTGYGPEMYVLPRAQSGRYRVFAHFYASHQNRASARTRVQATVVRRWGSPDEQISQRVITLANARDRHDLAEIDVR